MNTLLPERAQRILLDKKFPGDIRDAVTSSAGRNILIGSDDNNVCFVAYLSSEGTIVHRLNMMAPVARRPSYYYKICNHRCDMFLLGRHSPTGDILYNARTQSIVAQNDGFILHAAYYQNWDAFVCLVAGHGLKMYSAVDLRQIPFVTLDDKDGFDPSWTNEVHVVNNNYCLTCSNSRVLQWDLNYISLSPRLLSENSQAKIWAGCFCVSGDKNFSMWIEVVRRECSLFIRR